MYYHNHKECVKQIESECFITKCGGKGPKLDKRKSIKDRKSILAEKCIDKGRKKSIENEKSNPKGGRKSSDLSEKSINRVGNSNCPPNCEIEKSTNDEKLIYAQKSSPKDNRETLSSLKEKSTKVEKSASPKRSNKGKKLNISEKSTSVKKSIADLMSEVVRSCGKYFCPEKCGKFFGTKNPIKKHLLSHRPQNEWPIVCLFCGKHFQCLNDLPKHLKTQQHINDSRIPKIGTPAWDEILAKSVNEV